MTYYPRKRPLSPRQQKFVEQYLITGVARQAAIRAGYAPASVGSTAWRLRRMPNVAKAIRLGRSSEARRAQVERERVLMELARVAFSDIGEVLDWTGGDDITLRPKAEISPHHRAAIAELAPRRYGKGPRVKFHNKTQALDAIARHLGLFDKTAPIVDPARMLKERQANREKIMRRINQIVEERIAERCKAGTLMVVESGPNAGAPLNIPSAEDSALASPPPIPSPSRGEGKKKESPSPLEGEGCLALASPATGEPYAKLGEGSALPGRTFPPGFALPPKR